MTARQVLPQPRDVIEDRSQKAPAAHRAGYRTGSGPTLTPAPGLRAAPLVPAQHQDPGRRAAVAHRRAACA